MDREDQWTDNECCLNEDAEPERSATPLDEQPLIDVLAGKSGASQLLSDRPAQQSLLRLIVRGFNQGRLCAAEGGPGVGKSLAYLLPACQWVKQNGGRVVLATSTINLQQQLLHKDIPLACRLLGIDVRVEEVKGWSNYVCLYRLSQMDSGANLFDQHRRQKILWLRQWAKGKHDGSRSSLSKEVDPQLWREVSAESDNCHRQRCPFYRDCFVLRARRAAHQADILVVNHHILLSDLGLRDEQGLTTEDVALLPPFDRLVIDEAHNLERNAASLLSVTFSKSRIESYLKRFFDGNNGLWSRVSPHWPASIAAPPLLRSAQAVEQAALDMEGLGLDLLGGARCHYLGYGKADARIDQALLPAMNNVVLQLGVLEDQLAQVADELKKMGEAEEECALLHGEWLRMSRRFAIIRTAMGHFCDYSQNENYGCWWEKSSAGGCLFYVAPVHLGEVLRDLLYRQIPAISFLSATLTVEQRFDYWFNRVGLSEEHVLTETFPSPFDFRKNARLLLAANAPSPQSPLFPAYLSRSLAEILAVSGGRALLLFTSYYALNQAYNDLLLTLPHCELLKQGTGAKSSLLARFREREESVLLATDSFWEGVDVAGPSLSLVVICRLPFRTPDDPWLKLRCQAIEEKGINSFNKYQIPEAIIKFRQGCGRLLRTPEDRGVVLVLDGRLESKYYGQFFRSSLQQWPQEHLTPDEISLRMRQLKKEGFLGAP